jgi:hypothetical protein
MSNQNYSPHRKCNRPLPIKPKVRVIKKCFYKDICHEVPCHTHYINHTIYRHKYIPKYTCSKEETCEDIHLNSPKC